MPSRNARYKVITVGGGSTGISVAARLLHAREWKVAVLDPAEVHYCQPLWTLVGGGCALAGGSRDQEEFADARGRDHRDARAGRS